MQVTLRIIEKMELVAKSQRLDDLYQKQVDNNLFDDKCDYEKSGTALYFFPEENRFGFVRYITRHDMSWSNAFEQQNVVAFVATVDAHRAVASDLSELVGFLKEVAEQNWLIGQQNA